MAFVAILPAAGTVLTGLGAAASSIPLIGGTLGAGLGGLGGAATALGAGNIMGAVGSLGSGMLGVGTNLYTGADKLLGGFLPNLGGGIGITPQAGFLGPAGLGVLGGPGQFLGQPTGTYGGSAQLQSFLDQSNSTPLGGLQDLQSNLMPGGDPTRREGFMGVVDDAKAGYESSGLKDIVDAGKFMQGAYNAYQHGPQGPSPYANTPAGQAQRPVDQPGVVPIPSAPMQAPQGVNLVPAKNPNPFRASSNLAQNTPSLTGYSGLLPSLVSPNVENRLAKLDEPFIGSDFERMRAAAEAKRAQEEQMKRSFLQDSLGRNAMSISGSY